MNLKAQGLLNAASYIRETYGAPALAKVTQACSPAVRDRLATTLAINWIPHEELEEFLLVADRLLGKGDAGIALASGAWAARKSLGTLGLRLAFFLARPEFLMRRTAGVWRQYNDRGDLLVLEFTDGRMVLELVDADYTSWTICSTVTSWLHEAGRATGMPELVTTHTECRGRRGSRCVWHLRWRGAGASTPPSSSSMRTPSSRP